MKLNKHNLNQEERIFISTSSFFRSFLLTTLFCMTGVVKLVAPWKAGLEIVHLLPGYVNEMKRLANVRNEKHLRIMNTPLFVCTLSISLAARTVDPGA